MANPHDHIRCKAIATEFQYIGLQGAHFALSDLLHATPKLGKCALVRRRFGGGKANLSWTPTPQRRGSSWRQMRQDPGFPPQKNK